MADVASLIQCKSCGTATTLVGGYGDEYLTGQCPLCHAEMTQHSPSHPLSPGYSYAGKPPEPTAEPSQVVVPGEAADEEPEAVAVAQENDESEELVAVNDGA